MTPLDPPGPTRLASGAGFRQGSGPAPIRKIRRYRRTVQACFQSGQGIPVAGVCGSSRALDAETPVKARLDDVWRCRSLFDRSMGLPLIIGPRLVRNRPLSRGSDALRDQAQMARRAAFYQTHSLKSGQNQDDAVLSLTTIASHVQGGPLLVSCDACPTDRKRNRTKKRKKLRLLTPHLRSSVAPHRSAAFG